MCTYNVPRPSNEGRGKENHHIHVHITCPDPLVRDAVNEVIICHPGHLPHIIISSYTYNVPRPSNEGRGEQCSGIVHEYMPWSETQ